MIANTQESFFQKLDEEMKKINSFYESKIEEMTRSKLYMVERLKDIQRKTYSEKISQAERPQTLTEPEKIAAPALSTYDVMNTLTAKSIKSVFKRKQRKGVATLKKSLLEYYRALLLLLNYQKLNYTCLVKILKKFDKVNYEASEIFL